MDYAANIPNRLSKWLYLAVFLAGGLTVLAFAPFSIYPLAWFGPAFLFYALTKANTRSQYVKLSWVYGLGLFGLGASWPFYSLYFFANAHILIALLGTSLFVAFVSFCSTGLFGFIASFFRHFSLFLRLLLFFPAAWVISEWVRVWFLTGFPWLFLGNTQIDSLFSAIAPVTGVLGVSYICALLAGALLSFYFGNSTRRAVQIEADPVNQLVSNKAFVEERLGTSVRVIAASIIVVLVIVSVGLSQINWTKKKGKSLIVSVLQSNLAQKVKLQPSSLLPTIDLYKEMTQQSRDSDLIVWPETALFDSFDRHMDSLILPLQKSLENTDKAILLGGFYVNEKQGVENSVLSLSGESRDLYSKRHLVPFGEYTPLLKYLRWLDNWIQLPYDNVSKGKNNGILKINDYVAQMTICYEDAFGSEMIASLPEADLLINVTHDGWFTGSLEPYQHMQIARMRSLEMGRYMVRSTTNGPSGIIDEKGRVVETAPVYTKSIITGEVQLMQGTTPYVRWGNWLIVLLMSAMLLLGLIVKR